MKKILISAFSCQPGKGSEPGVGWNWSLMVARNYDVYVLTRTKMKKYIEPEIPPELADTLHFIYCDSSAKLRKITIYLEYLNWQRRAYKKAKQVCRDMKFDYVWHLTFGNMFLPTYMYRLPSRFILGPVGGGEQVAKQYWRTFPFHKRIVHMLKYFMGKNFRIFPWVYNPIKKADVIIARTEDTKMLFPKAMHNKIKIHADSFTKGESDFYFPDDTPDILKRSSGLNFVYTGRIIDIKNVGVLVYTAEKLSKAFPDSRIHVLGDGDERPRIEALAKEKGLDDYIVFYGNVERSHLFKSVKSADAFLFPSLRDATCWSMVEAMFFEIPIVAYDVNGMHCTLSHECAELVPIGDRTPAEATSAFADAALKVARMSDDERKKMGQAGKKLLLSKSTESVVKFISELLN